MRMLYIFCIGRVLCLSTRCCLVLYLLIFVVHFPAYLLFMVGFLDIRPFQSIIACFLCYIYYNALYLLLSLLR